MRRRCRSRCLRRLALGRHSLRPPRPAGSRTQRPRTEERRESSRGSASWLRTEYDVPVFSGAGLHRARIVAFLVVPRPGVGVVTLLEIERDRALGGVAIVAHAGGHGSAAVLGAADLWAIEQEVVAAGECVAVALADRHDLHGQIERVDEADVVPIEVVEVRVEGEFGQGVVLRTRVFAGPGPVALGTERLGVRADVDTFVRAGRQRSAIDVAARVLERLAATIDEHDGRQAITCCATVDAPCAGARSAAAETAVPAARGATRASAAPARRAATRRAPARRAPARAVRAVAWAGAAGDGPGQDGPPEDNPASTQGHPASVPRLSRQIPADSEPSDRRR